MIIRTHQLGRRFGAVEAIQDLTLEIPEGSVFALLGPNGAGKTTAIKVLMNILQPSAGRAEILGVDSRRLGREQFLRIGYVSENLRLPEWMTVGYFLSYCRAFYPDWRDDDLAALNQSYELPLKRKIGRLSRGMRVKTALASSLAYRPRLLVLDEPFSGLDVLVREQLIESILERTPESTVFIASHDLAEIDSFASHVGYLDNGRLHFVEEMTALSDRFREVEVTLEDPVPWPGDWPSHWLNRERSSIVIRFTDSKFNSERTEQQIHEIFPGARSVMARSLSLRQIFVALAKSAKQERREN
jgi:ABC-2 type transport system ATP-binding protein